MNATIASERVNRTSPWLVAAVGLLIGVALVIRNLIPVGWDITTFSAFGADAAETLEYGQSLLGDVAAREDLGHDGKFYFIQANDPWFVEPTEHASYLDRPLYRAQRMLYPTLAGGLGLFSPHVVVWTMVAINVAALGLGTFVTSHIARAMGGSDWWGLAFGLNVGLLNELLVGGAGVLAMLLLVCSVVAVQRGMHGWAVAAMASAVLSREAMLLGALGVALWLWRRDRRRVAALMSIIPLGAAGVWALYIRSRLGWDSGAAQVEEFGWPFEGFLGAFELWDGRPAQLLVGVAVLALLALATRRVFTDGWLIGWATVGFVPLAMFLSRQVWFNWYDITRAIAPVITAFLLMAFAGRRGHDESGRVKAVA